MSGERFGHWRTLIAASDDPSVRGVVEGTYLDGQRQGVFTTEFETGTVHEGEYLDGVQHGEWSHEYASGARQAGTYKDGKKDGRWTERSSRGDVSQGPFKAGAKHGRWTERTADGAEESGEYKEGKKHGEWIERDSDGSTRTYTYVEGEVEGPFSTRDPSGAVVTEGSYGPGRSKTGIWKEPLYDRGGGSAQGAYVGGERHGEWVFEWSDGRRDEGSYKRGTRDGLWTTSNDGLNAQQSMFVNGESQGWKRVGRWEIWYDSGGFEEIHYVDGKKHGKYRHKAETGLVVSAGSYVNDKKSGEWIEDQRRYGRRIDGRLGSKQGSYVDGKKEGRWVEYSQGRDQVRHYRNGRLHGPQTTSWDYGETSVDYYISGQGEVTRREWKKWLKANRNR